jgi:hypothetical protein
MAAQRWARHEMSPLPRVLLPDDHPDMLMVVARLLGKMFDVVGMVAEGESLLGAPASRLRKS